MNARMILLLLFLCLSGAGALADEPRIVAPPGYSPRMLASVERAHREISAELSRKLGFPLPEAPTIAICADHAGLEEVVGGPLPDWALGIALPHRNIIGVDSARIDMVGNNLVAVVRHEMGHLYLGVWERAHGKRLPLWFEEGICEWYSSGIHLDYPETVINCAVEETLLPLSSLAEKFPHDAALASQAYCQALSVVEYVTLTYGEKALADILSNFERESDFETAVEKALGVSMPALEELWRRSLLPSSRWLWRISRFFSYFSLFSAVALLVLFAFWRQRRRRRRMFERWESEEERRERLAYGVRDARRRRLAAVDREEEEREFWESLEDPDDPDDSEDRW